MHRNRRGLHLRNKAQRAEREGIGIARRRNAQRRVHALFVAQYRQRYLLAQIRFGPHPQRVPGWIAAVVKANDAVAGLKAGIAGGRVLRDKVDVRRLRPVGVYLVVHHVEPGHQHQGQDEVRHRAGQRNQHTLPARLGVQVARIARSVASGGRAGQDRSFQRDRAVAAQLALHLHVAA